MRVAFAGTPAFAARALEAIAAAGHEVLLVLTQPDRPAGRGLRLAPSAVAQAALTLRLPIQRPASLKDTAIQGQLREARLDVLVVAAYGLILPRAVLEIPLQGCLNIHASLLPRWRGAAPVQRAILAGDSVTGVSIMRMDEGLDTGPVLFEKRVPIGELETTGSLTEKLAGVGADAIVDALQALDDLKATPQDADRATYAAKVRKSEAAITWSKGCEVIDRQVRAFNPTPGAEATVGSETLKIWSAAPLPQVHADPGTIVSAGDGELIVACGSGGLRLDIVQRPGGRRMSAQEYLRGSSIGVGAHRK